MTNPPDILYVASLFGGLERGPKQIRGATLEKLVEVITLPENDFPTQFFNMVITCHKLYTNSKHFLNLIIQRFRPEDVTSEGEWNSRFSVRVNKPLRLLRMSLPVFLGHNPHSRAVDIIERFALEMLETHNHNDAIRGMAKSLLMFIASARDAPQTDLSVQSLDLRLQIDPLLSLPSRHPLDGLEVDSIEHIVAEDMARELTLLQMEPYAAIHPWELLWFVKSRLKFHDIALRHDGAPEARAQMEKKMGHVIKLFDQFCGIVHWVRKEVDDAGRLGLLSKASMLRYFFALCQHLRALRNLNTLGAVVVALHPHFGQLREILTEVETEELKEMMLLYQSASSMHGEADILSAHLQLSLSTKQYRDVDEAANDILPFVPLTLGNLQLLGGVNLYLDESEGPNLISLRFMESFDLVIRALLQNRPMYAFPTVRPIRQYLDRRLRMGHNVMRTQALKHLCRVVVWRKGINYRSRVPSDLIDYLGEPGGASDVLTVISSL